MVAGPLLTLWDAFFLSAILGGGGNCLSIFVEAFLPNRGRYMPHCILQNRHVCCHISS
ncbi:hypothetical protein GJAV_G00234050 [Gymnothorax javanicus]|nr:hypothetical protein GJAV_G00234050 [Gymnothorax javanicus]